MNRKSKCLVLYGSLNRRWCLISLHCSSSKNTFCKAVILGGNLKQETLKSSYYYFLSSFVNLQSPTCLQLQFRVTSKKSMKLNQMTNYYYPTSSPAQNPTLTTTWGNWLLVVFSCCCTVCSFVMLYCIFKNRQLRTQVLHFRETK